jgi:DNA-binding response OmpR family regulator
MARKSLVVEDHAPSGELLAQLLAREGYAVRTAPDGLAALDEIEREPPDLILSNVRMPRRDGIALVHRLRERGSAVPVVLVSDDPEAAPAGVPFLTKPIDITARRELLARVLGQTGLRDS